MIRRGNSGRRGPGVRASGVVLIVVLWVVAILAVVCLALGGSVRFQHVHLRRDRDDLAARGALLGAVELARSVLLADPTAADTLADGWSGSDPAPFTLTTPAGEVRLIAPGRAGRWGLADESARLNANTATAEMLAGLPGMSVAAAEAFVAARGAPAAPDGPAAPPSGLTGPVATPAQLARMLGEAMIGSPAAPAGPPVDPNSRAAAAGIAAPVAGVMRHLTISTRQRNLDAAGAERANVNTAPRDRLAGAFAGRLSDEQLDAVIAARRDRPFSAIGELLTRPMEITDAEGRKRTIRITVEQFKPAADQLTVSDEAVLAGLVNVNTAAPEVLAALPGLTDAAAAAIVARRADADADGLKGIGWLLDAIDAQAFARLCRSVTTRTQQFRLRAEMTPPAGDEGASGRRGPARRCALAILERDGGRCGVLTWTSWVAPGAAATGR